MIAMPPHDSAGSASTPGRPQMNIGTTHMNIGMLGLSRGSTSRPATHRASCSTSPKPPPPMAGSGTRPRAGPRVPAPGKLRTTTSALVTTRPCCSAAMATSATVWATFQSVRQPCHRQPCRYHRHPRPRQRHPRRCRPLARRPLARRPLARHLCRLPLHGPPRIPPRRLHLPRNRPMRRFSVVAWAADCWQRLSSSRCVSSSGGVSERRSCRSRRSCSCRSCSSTARPRL